MERDRRPVVAVAAAALLGFCTIASMFQSTDAHVFSGKAFRKAQQDCLQFLGISEFRLSQYNKYVYPPDRDTMCLIRCIGITLDFWDDTLGFNLSCVEQQFGPLVDASFKKQLNETIANKLDLIDPLDNCSRAYYAFRTMRAQLRQLLNLAPGTSTTTPSVVFQPLTAVQIVNVLSDCARDLHLPAAYLTAMTKGMLVDCPEVHCLIRCAAIRSGVYSDDGGAQLDNLHRQLDPLGEDLSSFTMRQNLCLQRHQQPACADKCTRAYRQFFTCLRPDYERFFIKNIESVMQLPLFQLESCAKSTPAESNAMANMDAIRPLLTSF
ncbi:general odorant-binding protein 45-like [Anopheles nili]|uniref:general odorant-binding protein 45-like n=1 Tax=Anopheles nili TaxID=185578 RepID=UPI00237A1BCE|nr:general odorant-binding protein 45-like [Anopheles nili]